VIRNAVTIWLVAAALVVACSPAATPTPEPPNAAPTRAAAVTIEVPGDSDPSDIPWLLAVEAMEAQGYKVNKVTFDDAGLASVAFQKGDLDFASLDNPATMTAIMAGAPIVMVLDDSADTYLLVATNDIQKCSDLDGRHVAIGGLHVTHAALLYAYVARQCPDAQPDYLVIDGSGNRYAALLAGELDATIVHWDDMIKIEADGEGRFHPLAYFSDEVPGVTAISQFTRRGLGEQYPQTVEDMIRAVLEARRKVQDPQVLADEIAQRYETEPAVAQQTAQIYLDHKLWNVNGDISPETVQANIDFLVANGSLEPGLKAADVADQSYLNAVLEEIGRQ
jgi:ABC-type nitrate/sulfonate/bicarbonate transport system substrate-binding protein